VSAFVKRILARTPSTLTLVVAAALVSLDTLDAAEIYKWKDDKGVVHYSNTPPPQGSSATVLDESKGKVSVVPAYKPPPAAPGAGNDPALQDRVRRLERELDQERQSQSAATQNQTQTYDQWRAQCLAQRRTDCDDPGAAAPVYDGYYPGPQVVRPPGPPIGSGGSSGAPPGYTVGPGPGGIGGAYVPNPPPLIQNTGRPPPGPRPVPLQR
jgi:Domain of unknown function (DUF4124)